MSKNLVIVESPAKAKTIEKFLGSEYHVLSSQGHVRDIEPIGKNSMGIDFEHGYMPNYAVDEHKIHLIEQLKREAHKADTVWLASDEDREGEAIAWHLKEVLELGDKDTKRIVFHEITKPAIQEAIQHPRDIDYNLVNAQQARRVLDRIVGFELSPILWKKVTTGLSAGRVQSVAVRLIVEREREIETFRASSSYRIFADFIGVNPGDASVLKCELNHRFSHKKDAICTAQTRYTSSGASVHHFHSPARGGAKAQIQCIEDDAFGAIVVRKRKDHVYAYRLREPLHFGFGYLERGHCRAIRRRICPHETIPHEEQRCTRGTRSNPSDLYERPQRRYDPRRAKVVRVDLETHHCKPDGRSQGRKDHH